MPKNGEYSTGCVTFPVVSSVPATWAPRASRPVRNFVVSSVPCFLTFFFSFLVLFSHVSQRCIRVLRVHDLRAGHHRACTPTLSVARRLPGRCNDSHDPPCAR
eukprot:scaffold776_cov347-Pavlova_lutheri.AAC.31